MAQPFQAATIAALLSNANSKSNCSGGAAARLGFLRTIKPQYLYLPVNRSKPALAGLLHFAETETHSDLNKKGELIMKASLISTLLGFLLVFASACSQENTKSERHEQDATSSSDVFFDGSGNQPPKPIPTPANSCQGHCKFGLSVPDLKDGTLQCPSYNKCSCDAALCKDKPDDTSISCKCVANPSKKLGN